MSDRGKMVIFLVAVICAFLAFIWLASVYDNKNFGKVIKQYQLQGKEQQASPEDIKKGFQ